MARSLSVCVALALALACGVRAAEWSDTGSMVNVRTGHTATALLDGRVLVAGGFGGPPTGSRACLATAETYDPVSGRWNATGPMNFARCFHAATLLDDGSGRVIVTGGVGVNGSALASIEFFDPASNSWASARLDDMRTPRAYHQSALLERGDVLVIGGYNSNGYLASVEQYRVDTPTSPWNPVGALQVPRANFTATRLPNDRILVAGGQTGPNSDTNLAEFCSNLLYCTWVATANDMDVARSSHTATLLTNGDVLITGGFTGGGATPTASAEVYDNSRFGNTLTEMVAARALHQTVLLLDGTALAIGGVGSAAGDFLDTVEAYNDGSRRWTRGELGSALGTARASFTATRLFNGVVLAAGGTNDRVAATASAELYV